MIKIENVVLPSNEQWEAVIRGMRNPKNSWDRTDSGPGCFERNYWHKKEEGLLMCNDCSATYESKSACVGDMEYCLGPNDLKLMNQLAAGGPVHAKYRRMIPVYLDITAPLYWWKEFDTYKVGTVANSCSTMHKVHAKEFTLDDFSWEQLLNTGCDVFEYESEKGLFSHSVQPLGLLKDIIIPALNICRERYLETKDKADWWQMIQLLPSSYNQKRTVMLNYEVLVNIYNSRRGHKLDEWHDFCKWIESLPYAELITGKEG